MNNNITIPQQIIYNTPQFQKKFKSDIKYGGENTPPQIYLTRLLNNTLRALSENCIIEGLKVTIDVSKLNTQSMIFNISKGHLIIDSTLFEIIDTIQIQDNILNNNYDSFIISVDYDFPATIQNKELTLKINHYNTISNISDGTPGKIILALFQYELDQSLNIINIKDISLNVLGLPIQDIILNNVNYQIRPLPDLVKRTFSLLFKDQILNPSLIIKNDITGINNQLYEGFSPPLGNGFPILKGTLFPNAYSTLNYHFLHLSTNVLYTNKNYDWVPSFLNFNDQLLLELTVIPPNTNFYIGIGQPIAGSEFDIYLREDSYEIYQKRNNSWVKLNLTLSDFLT
jgi:hypothetical protein